MNVDNTRPTQLTTWSEIHKTEHFVQFYEKDLLLVSAVTGYFSGAFRNNETAILIATPEHRTAIEKQLHSDGHDLSALKAYGNYFSLDAVETLSKFMVDGLPDERLFNATVGAVMAGATCHGQGVRAFGEMVAVLWAEGNLNGAIRLEELWNKLAKDYSFALFCAYPLDSFRDKKNLAPFVNVCQQHSRVISTASCAA